MAERKATFRFVMDKAITVATKNLLSAFAFQHVRDAVAFSNRTAMRLQETIHYLKQLERIETRVLEKKLLDDEADEREDLRLVQESLVHLLAAQQGIETLRLRKLDAGLALEEALDPIYAPKPGPKKTEPSAEDVTPAPDAKPITMEFVEIPAPAANVALHETAMPSITVKFDADLLEKARQELAERTREE